MTKVLVTGAHGLLGSTLVPYLRAQGHEVVGCSRTEATIIADLTDAMQVNTVMDQVAPDVCVNLAANTSVDECERNPQLAYCANTRIVENLARWMRERGRCSHLIQISTDQVYDGSGPHKERDVTLTNYYGFSKYAGELAAVSVPSTILRTNLFGPSRCSGRMSLSDWLVKSLVEGREMTVFDDVLFSPLTLQHLSEFVGLALVQRRQGVFNLGSKEGTSKADFAFALAEMLNLSTKHMKRGNSDQVKLVAYRPKDMRMDSSCFEGAFGVALPTLKEEVRSVEADYARQSR